MNIDVSPEALARSRAARAALLAQPLPPPENENASTGEIEAFPNNAQVTPQFKVEYSKAPAKSARGEQSKQSGTSPPAYGATKAEWQCFARLALDDLLPVVSDGSAKISPQSTMTALGKTPSQFNRNGHAVGIPGWTSHHTTQDDIEKWSRDSRLGICVQTRLIRAIDCDVENVVLARNVHDEINKYLGVNLPTRSRSTSPKFLLAFDMPGDYPKRVIQCEGGGMIEFLGSGNQFVACGTHPSKVKYEWKGGLPDSIPTLAPEQFEKLWRRLEECFAAEGTTSSTEAKPAKAAVLAGAVANDRVARALIDKGASVERDGKLLLTCPFADCHTPGGDDTVAYFPKHTGGFAHGHIKCLHASCAERTDGDFLEALGIASPTLDDFDIVTPDTASDAGEDEYLVMPWEESNHLEPPVFIIKGVLPEAALAVIYGAPGSGKSFFALDLACAVAGGIAWRGHKVKQGAVVYIAAEDAPGIRTRIKAYTQEHKIAPGTMPLGTIDAAPNFMDGQNIKKVERAVRNFGAVSLIFVDTWSRVIAGFDENSAADITKAVKHCAALHRATGATVVLIHHSGKDASKGARGSTALLGACDCEIEVIRTGDERVATVTKLKNGADGARFGFKLNVVPVGMDADGDVVSSCVLEHSTAKPKAKQCNRTGGVAQKIAQDAFNDLSIGGPVMVADLIDATANQMTGNPGKRDTRRQRAIRAIDSLIADGAWAKQADGVIGQAGSK